MNESAPATPAPDEPTTFSGWFRKNAVQLVTIAVVAVVVFRFLHPFDVLLAGVGLSLIIFIHELGHFMAAKWCDVHVKTFSIGFGPALPFCSFRYGETTYKLALIPLGGYVAMVGQDDEDLAELQSPESPAGDLADAAEQQLNYPRSYLNKSVGQRMLIISAGVIMNIILGAVCFVVTYTNGVDEVPAIAASVEPGSAAWQIGMRPGSEVTEINGKVNPWFDDLRVEVSSTGHDEAVSVSTKFQSETATTSIVPQVQEGARLPQLGISPPMTLTLFTSRRSGAPPYMSGSPAAEASAPAADKGFRGGDRIVAMTDPANPSQVTPIDPAWSGLPSEYFDYTRRLNALAGKPVTFHVVRKDDASNTPLPVTVAPAYRKDVGLRMRMGTVASVRRGSPAEKAGVQARQTNRDEVTAPGDQIVAIEVANADGTRTRFTADPPEGAADPKLTTRPLDPIRLPFELGRWEAQNPSARAVKLTVLRDVDHTQRRVTMDLEWDPAFPDAEAMIANPGTPVPLNGLGLAYHVQSVVDAVAPDSAAAKAGLKPNDKLVEVRFKSVDADGTVVDSSWQPCRPHQWAFVDYALQTSPPHAFDAKVERGSETIEVSLAAANDTTWPVSDRGLLLMRELRTQKAENIGEALQMGFHRTVRSVRMIYLGLYSMVFGRVSFQMMSGPITLARASYLIAGEDIWHLLLWMGLISINLAVVNFLPIPVLDGGHMVFLLYEWVRGKPAPIAVQAILTYLGLAMILGLMLFVIGLDVWRLITK